MSIELKVGEWYETEAAWRVKIICDVRDQGVPDDTTPFIAIDRNGHATYYSVSGVEYNVDGVEYENNIIRYLPGCTGWDWVEPKPEKWRDATPEDAIKTPHPRCRARVASSGERTVYVYGELVGYYVSGAGSQWVVNAAGTVSNYSLCQVLDE